MTRSYVDSLLSSSFVIWIDVIFQLEEEEDMCIQYPINHSSDYYVHSYQYVDVHVRLFPNGVNEMMSEVDGCMKCDCAYTYL